MFNKVLRKSKSRLSRIYRGLLSGKSRLFAGKKIFVTTMLTIGLVTLINAQGITNTLGGNSATDRFFIENQNRTKILTVTGDSKVGIGTTEPTSVLDVFGGGIRARRNSNEWLEMLDNSSSGAFLTSHSREGNKKPLVIQSVHDGSGTPAGETYLLFQVGDEGAPTNVMMIKENGKVGIGTTEPTSALDVFGGGIRARRNSNEWVEILNNSASGGYITSHSRESNKKPLVIQSVHDGSGTPAGETYLLFQVGDEGTPTNVMMITENGNVGIGTTTPDYQLEVVGSHADVAIARFENTSTFPGTDGIEIQIGSTNSTTGNAFLKFYNGNHDWLGDVRGDHAGGVSYTTASDARLKTNIVDFAGGLDMVSRMKVRKYEFIEAPGKERIGFLAQELQTVFPQAVSGDPEGDVKENPMGVDYGRVTPVLVSAIQELIAENKALEERLERLEALLNVRQ